MAALRAKLEQSEVDAPSCAVRQRKACVDVAGDALSGMIEVVLAHSSREDPSLRGIGSPWAVRHIEAHAALAEELCALTGLFMQSPVPVLQRLTHLAERFLAHDAMVSSKESPVVAFSS